MLLHYLSATKGLSNKLKHTCQGLTERVRVQAWLPWKMRIYILVLVMVGMGAGHTPISRSNVT